MKSSENFICSNLVSVTSASTVENKIKTISNLQFVQQLVSYTWINIGLLEGKGSNSSHMKIYHKKRSQKNAQNSDNCV